MLLQTLRTRDFDELAGAITSTACGPGLGGRRGGRSQDGKRMDALH